MIRNITRHGLVYFSAAVMLECISVETPFPRNPAGSFLLIAYFFMMYDFWNKTVHDAVFCGKTLTGRLEQQSLCAETISSLFSLSINRKFIISSDNGLILYVSR